MIYRRNPEVELREIAGERLLVHMNQGASVLFTLNGTGAWLWRALEQPADETVLAAGLVEAFGVPADHAAADLAGFLERMTARGLLLTA